MHLTPDELEAILAVVQCLGLALIAAWSRKTNGTVQRNEAKIDKVLNGGRDGREDVCSAANSDAASR